MDTKPTFELEYPSTADVLPLHKDDLQPPPKYTPNIPKPSSSQLRIVCCIFLATMLGFIAGMALPRPVFDATAWSISPFLRDVRITGVAPFLPDGHPFVVVVTDGEGEGDHIANVGDAMTGTTLGGWASQVAEPFGSHAQIASIHDKTLPTFPKPSLVLVAIHPPATTSPATTPFAQSASNAHYVHRIVQATLRVKEYYDSRSLENPTIVIVTPSVQEDTVAIELYQACKALANELEVGVMPVDDVGALEEVLKEEAGEGLPPFEHVQKNVRIGVLH